MNKLDGRITEFNCSKVEPELEGLECQAESKLPVFI